MTDHENFVFLIFGFIFHKISNTASHKDEYLHFSQAVVSCYTTIGGCHSSSYRSSWFIVIIVLRLSVASQEDHVWEGDSVPPVIIRSFSHSSSKPWPSIPWTNSFLYESQNQSIKSRSVGLLIFCFGLELTLCQVLCSLPCFPQSHSLCRSGIHFPFRNCYCPQSLRLLWRRLEMEKIDYLVLMDDDWEVW